ncbi:hypothetical protein [Aliarcobacter butzleri]|uniref:hypothetical protein n=1 Tax=Aliarcobacter butzleri TaxID=28197 RepID=UPI00263C26A6|nr:hypothetical protein [Aliarcobacter butzleri]MDN5050588.1 hypothetical protein [Aliarcobacter butzleri]MDN5057718.1 hypothetical protein [Aliarcobacter butzleri]
MLKIKNHNFDTDLYYNNICIEEIFSRSTKKDAKNKNKTIEKIYSNNWIRTKEKNLENIYQVLIEKNNDFKSVFGNIKLKDLITSNPNKLKEIIEKVEKNIKKINDKTKESNLKNTIKDIFKYDGKFQPKIASFFEKHLNPKTCYYCNIDYINVYEEQEKNKKEYKNKFTLDHFIDKGDYPYLALSIFNLIPSCYACNSKIKKSVKFYSNEKLKNENPFLETFDFHQKVKFKLFLDDSCKNLHIKSKDDIDITLKEQFSDMYDKYIDIFKLNERYKVHKDIVFDMIQKAELYPQSRLKELENLTGIPFQQIKKDIFNLIDESEDLSKQPFSKLIVDISKELGII